jgi:hypothetical protein
LSEETEKKDEGRWFGWNSGRVQVGQERIAKISEFVAATG